LSPQAETDNSGDTGDVYQQVQATAMRLLVRREHSALELRRKLNDRGYTAAAVESVIVALLEAGALSDRRFADLYVQGRFERGFGPVRIGVELRERGVDAALIEAALGSYAASDWQLSARRQRHKRFGAGRPAAFTERVRQMRFLQQRGFSAGQIRTVLEDETEAAARDACPGDPI
jgi:regulatory protein